MGQNTKIQWTDETWNPVTGCEYASPGCKNCYAVKMTKRLEAMGQEKYEGLLGKAHFNGVVKTHEASLTIPLEWKKPRMVFVNSMSDLFHPSVPFEFIDRVFDTIWHTPMHTYQILTKRPGRLVEYMRERCYRRSFGWTDKDRTLLSPGDIIHLEDIYYRNQCGYVGDCDDDREWVCDHPKKSDRGENCSCCAYECPIASQADSREELEQIGVAEDYHFGPDGYAEDCEWMKLYRRPKYAIPKNVWLGFSAENQDVFNDRMREFRALRYMTPYLTLFCSMEPLLGPINTRIKYWEENEVPENWNTLGTYDFSDGGGPLHVPYLNWVIVGGESGSKARPCNIEWIRSIVSQCQDASVPVFVKQLGKVVVEDEIAWRKKYPVRLLNHRLNAYQDLALERSQLVAWYMKDSKGGNPDEWPEDLRVRQFPVTSK